MTSIRHGRKELSRFHSSCHGNWVTIATRYVADVYSLKEPPYQIWTQQDPKQRSYWGFKVVAMATGLHSNKVRGWSLSSQGSFIPNMTSIRLRTNELSRSHCGCHGNWVTIAMRYVAVCILSKNLHTKYELNTTQKKGVIEVLSWLPWQLECHSNEVCGWCLSSQGSFIPNMTSIRLKTKKLSRFHSSCHGNWVTIATRYVADVYSLKEPPYQIWTQHNSKERSYWGFKLDAIAMRYVADVYRPKEVSYQIWLRQDLWQSSY